MSKKQGELNQLRFLLKCYEKGFQVSLPYGDSAKYDCVVDGNGKLYRVQIKSTSYQDKSRRQDRYKIIASGGCDAKKPYTKDDIDILAVYIVPHNTWYLVPVERLEAHISTYFAPQREGKGKYEPFKEGWEIFE